jgi:hypothetical protein
LRDRNHGICTLGDLGGIRSASRALNLYAEESRANLATVHYGQVPVKCASRARYRFTGATGHLRLQEYSHHRRHHRGVKGQFGDPAEAASKARSNTRLARSSRKRNISKTAQNRRSALPSAS